MSCKTLMPSCEALSSANPCTLNPKPSVKPQARKPKPNESDQRQGNRDVIPKHGFLYPLCPEVDQKSFFAPITTRGCEGEENLSMLLLPLE